MTDFLVVKGPLSYNVDFDRLVLRAFKVVTSIYHFTVKFPIPKGMVLVQGDQHIARLCYSSAIKASTGNKKKFEQLKD